MSTFIGKVNNKPFMHMTSDTKTEANMQGAPSSTTLFHSDLPYVFAREQWEIDTYTDWNGSGGGRKFALPAEAQTFKSNNPDLAYLVMLEDANGHTTVLTPTLNVVSSNWTQYSASYNAATVGSEYSVAFTDSDTQLENLTRNAFTGHNRSATFRLWDTNDTSITVFRHPRSGTWFNVSPYVDDIGTYARPHFANFAGAYSYQTYIVGRAKDAVSDSLDIVKVRLIALNVTNSASTFAVQDGYDDTAGISISNDEFSVGGVNLLENAPLISRGVKNSGDTVTPIYGTVSGNKVLEVNKSIKTAGKVNASNVVQDNNTPVIEIPDPVPATPSAVFDFKNQTFSINGNTVFSSSGTAQGLIASGSKTVNFDLSISYGSSNVNNTITLSSTSTGSFTNPTANTLYLLAFKFSASSGENTMTPVTLIGVGDNEIFTDYYNVRYWTGSTYLNWCWGNIFYINIDSSGNVTAKLRQQYDYRGLSSVTHTWGSIEARLIALNPA